MKKWIVLLGVLSFLGGFTQAEIIVPVGASLAPESGDLRYGDPNHVIDGSGLTDGAYVTGANTPDIWSTVESITSNNHSTDLVVWNNKPHDPNVGNPLAIDFDLGGVFAVESVVLWNYTGLDWVKRGLDAVDVYVSVDHGATWLLAASLTPVDANNAEPTPGQEFALPEPVVANAVKIVGTTTASHPALNEILFTGAAVPAVVVPVTADLAPESGQLRYGDPNHVIDGSGLTDGAYRTGDLIPEVWSTVESISSSDHSTDLVVWNNKPHDADVGNPLAVVLGLDTTYTVDSVVLWNYTGLNWVKRGLDAVDVYASADAGKTWTLAASITPVDANNAEPTPGQEFVLPEPVVANALKIVGTTTASHPALNEIVLVATQMYVEAPDDPAMDPDNGAVDVALGAQLSWAAQENVIGYTVNFGTDPKALVPGDVQTETVYDPGLLEAATTYYWRIDSITTLGETVIGELWSFTTVP